MRKNKTRIAIQKDGRLRDESFDFLKTLGIEFKRQNGRVLISPSVDKNIEALHVRHSDIPQYVQNGAADFGIVGANVLTENDFRVKHIKQLEFGTCRLVIAVPYGSKIKTIKHLTGERIATSHPNSLRRFLKENGLHASIVEIKGSVEIAPSLDLADAVCDITQTGRTLKENRLKELVTVYESKAVLIQSPHISSDSDKLFKHRI